MVLGVAAVVIVAAIGVPLGMLRLGNQVPAPPATNVAPEEPPQVAEREAPAKRRAAVPITPAEPEPVAKRVASTPAPPPVAAAARSRAGGSGSSRLDRESNSGAAQAPSVAASRATTPAPALVAAAAPATQAQVQPQSAAPEPPSGRLFDQTGVDDPPRILSRVEPRLPNDLPERRGNDVVVVRILVSHTGHPFQVGLLRRSRLGPSLDDAVVAAVKQWTFAPARKRGEAVSCWFNLGVPVVVN